MPLSITQARRKFDPLPPPTRDTPQGSVSPCAETAAIEAFPSLAIAIT